MKPLPHEYSVSASANDAGSVSLTSHDLPVLQSAPPVEFGGPGDLWSPEELFLASVADCFILTFRAIARGSNLSWKGIDATVDGVLSRVEHTTRFTEITLHAALTLDELGTDDDKALRLLEKAKTTCLVTNSLAVPVGLDAKLLSARAAAAEA
jgi:organic hydroperoxide reductase OsmC/OhrA